jgi:hypothetical protein
MGILREIKEDDKDWSLWGANIPDRCFLCGDELSFPLVYWSGCNGSHGNENELQIWLHPICAASLGKGLIVNSETVCMEQSE